MVGLKGGRRNERVIYWLLAPFHFVAVVVWSETDNGRVILVFNACSTLSIDGLAEGEGENGKVLIIFNSFFIPFLLLVNL